MTELRMPAVASCMHEALKQEASEGANQRAPAIVAMSTEEPAESVKDYLSRIGKKAGLKAVRPAQRSYLATIENQLLGRPLRNGGNYEGGLLQPQYSALSTKPVRRSLLLIAVQPPKSTVRCFLLYL